MISGDLTGSFNGFDFGTAHVVLDPEAALSGIFDMDASALGGATTGSVTVPTPKGVDNGVWPAPYYASMRQVSLAFDLVAEDGDDDTFATLIWAFLAATQPGADALNTLSIQVLGKTLTIQGTPSTRTCTPTPTEFAQQYAPATLVIDCPDPRWMSALSPSTVSLATGSGAATMTNAGNALAPAEIAVSGPFTALTMTNTTTSHAVTLTGSVASGTTVTVDMEARTVVDQDGNNLGASVTARDWWGLAPGANTITLAATGATSTTSATISGYSAWL